MWPLLAISKWFKYIENNARERKTRGGGQTRTDLHDERGRGRESISIIDQRKREWRRVWVMWN